MRTKPLSWWPLPMLWLAGWVFFGSAQGADTVRHDLNVRFDPGHGHLWVHDVMTLPKHWDTGSLEFVINRAFEVALTDPGATLEKREQTPEYAVYVAHLPPDIRRLSLSYEGQIRDPQRPESGFIAEEGVFLGPGARWYASFTDELHTLNLVAELPVDWLVVSHGAMTFDSDGDPRLIGWREDQPQDVLYLVGGPLRLFESASSERGQVFLRSPERRLAEVYLEATDRYLRFYEALLGPYAYDKFALVENFWESGYGMASFTLLGPRVIRLPFIPHTSYPHEVLHNWWGNGVYVNYATGNWSEGLTAYLSDHLLKEHGGESEEYRHEALQKYRNYVSGASDFPLTEFRAKHGSISEAVGYNKTMMFFHMLRLRVGDEAFLGALRSFYHKFLFHRAGYADLRLVFESVTGEDFAEFFKQWTERPGAPELTLEEVTAEPFEGGYRVSGVLGQSQSAELFQLRVPVAVQGVAEVRELVVESGSRRTPFEMWTGFEPVRLSVDPRFDIFRVLHRDENPPVLSELFGAETIRVHVSESDLRSRRLDVLLPALGVTAEDVSTLGAPQAASTPYWLLGWDKEFVEHLSKRLPGVAFSADGETIEIEGRIFRRQGDCVVVMGRDTDTHSALGWVGCETPALKSLAAKLPHYGKYSYLVFDASTLENRLKRKWTVTTSPLIHVFKGDRVACALTPRAGLAAGLDSAQ